MKSRKHILSFQRDVWKLVPLWGKLESRVLFSGSWITPRVLASEEAAQSRMTRKHGMTRSTKYLILGSVFLLVGLAALTIYLQTNHQASAA